MNFNRYLFAVVLVFSPVLLFSQQSLPVKDDRVVQEGVQTQCSGILKLADGNTNSNSMLPSQETNRNSVTAGGQFSPAAVPANNDCGSAIGLTVNAPCVNGTNKESGTQSGENSACQGSVTKTVWYKFVATASSMYVEIERTASSGCYLSSAVFSGSCLPSSAISCENAAGGPNLNIHNLTGLSAGTTYFIQVAYTGGGPCGNNGNNNTGADFCIRVGTPQSCASCNNPCGSICVFPTNPTVAQVTSTCTQYQLTSRMNAGDVRTECYMFTAVAANFSLQMIINTVGCAGGNVTTFNWKLYSSGCGAVVQSGDLTNMNANGLTIGAGYVLCYTWTAACQHNSVYPYIVATSPLPVKLLMFDGKQLDDEILLTWSTATEINNDYFSVERSDDGIHFESIGQLSGSGNSNHTISYKFTDRNPLNSINYYRLRQVDYDRQSSVSKIIAVHYYENFTVKVDNNPVENDLQVSLHSEYNARIKMQIVNDLGETVQQFSNTVKKGYNKISIRVDQLRHGMYFLKIESVDGSTWTRFLKL